MKVPDVRRNLVPDTWTADGEGALAELGPCPHDNSCVGCRVTEMAMSRFFSVEFDDIVQVCWPTLIKSSVHHGGDLELNSCLHRQPVKTLYCRLDVRPVIQSKDKPSGYVLYTL